MRYKVRITQTEEYVKEVYIEAKSKEEALKSVKNIYEEKDIALSKHSFNGSEKDYIIEKTNKKHDRN